MTKKNLGAFYTPENTVRFMTALVSEKLENKKILEPSGGDGVFVQELIEKGSKPSNITVFDINPEVQQKIESFGVNFELGDTLFKNTLGENKYDLVIGNPPYLSKSSKYIKNNKLKLKKIYTEIGTHDTYAMFIYQGLKYLKEGGKLCFIISDTFLSLNVHEKLRNYLLNNCKILNIIRTPKDLFNHTGATVNTAIILIEKNNSSAIKELDDNEIKIISRTNSEKDYYSSPKLVKQGTFRALPGSVFYLDNNAHILKLFSKTPKLSEIIEGAIGMHTRNNAEALAAIEGSKLAELYSRKGRKVVSMSEIDGVNYKIYLKRGGEKPYYYPFDEAIVWNDSKLVERYVIPKNPFFGKEGIAISGISIRLSARYMPKGCLWDTNKTMGFVVKDPNISINYLIGLLNTDLYTRLANVVNNTSSIQIKDIRNLPFVYPDKETHDYVSNKTKEIIDKRKENINYDFSEMKSQIEEKINLLYFN